MSGGPLTKVFPDLRMVYLVVVANDLGPHLELDYTANTLIALCRHLQHSLVVKRRYDFSVMDPESGARQIGTLEFVCPNFQTSDDMHSS